VRGLSLSCIPRTLQGMPQRSTIILFNKPYGVLSQFTRGIHPAKHGTLSDYGPFPPRVYAAGRLDADSEGLLLLTDDPELTHRLLDPHFRHPRTYYVQVERVPDDRVLRGLASGTIRLDGERLLPARVRPLRGEPEFPPRPVPIRFRKNVPTAWLELTLAEGKNRQVRRMTAALGHPTLRLIRWAIGSLTCAGLDPGNSRALSGVESARFKESILRPQER
jgi:23S rRNA pseudouridine2457 synthase